MDKLVTIVGMFLFAMAMSSIAGFSRNSSPLSRSAKPNRTGARDSRSDIGGGI